MKLAEDRDTPVSFVKDGIERYCSPRCGHGCKKSDYDAVMADAEHVASTLGSGWSISAWDNGKWHVSISKGDAEITVENDRKTKEKTYSAWLRLPTGLDDQITHTLAICAEASTPEDALAFAVQDANTMISRVRESLNKLLD